MQQSDVFLINFLFHHYRFLSPTFFSFHHQITYIPYDNIKFSYAIPDCCIVSTSHIVFICYWQIPLTLGLLERKWMEGKGAERKSSFLLSSYQKGKLKLLSFPSQFLPQRKTKIYFLPYLILSFPFLPFSFLSIKTV